MRSSRRAYSAVGTDAFRTAAVVAMGSSGLLHDLLVHLQSALKIRSGLRSEILVRPQSPIAMCICSRRISKTRATPSAPSATSPQRAVRPSITTLAPRASPFTTAVPLEKAPPNTTAERPGAAPGVGGNVLIDQLV